MTDTTSTAPRLARPRALPQLQELGLIAVIILLMGLLSFLGITPTGRHANSFFNLDNLINGVATSTAIYAIMAVGMTCVIITGGIDISVGAIFGAAALGGAWILQHLAAPGDSSAWYASPWVALPVAFLAPCTIGLLCGLINGSLVVFLRMHPFIVTLATLSIFRGISIVLAPHPTIPRPPEQLPDAFTALMLTDFGGGIRLMPMIVTLFTVAAGYVYLHWMVQGREIYAVGGNEEAARFSGINVGWVKLRVYAIMGLTCGLAAMVSLGRFQTASTTTGQGDELIVIAAAVVGGASLTGGRGTALGALLGALVIRLIDNGIVLFAPDQQYSKIITGVAIIVAVAVDRLGEVMRQRRLARSRVL